MPTRLFDSTLPTSPTSPTQPSQRRVREGDVLAGKYVVERVLGVGGMGTVVAATHQQLGGRVALKFLLPELATHEVVVRRFLKEARAASQITSEHVARVTDVDTLDGGEPYLVMEYLEGRDLSSELAARGPLPVPEAVDYVLQALQAIAEAHAQGVVHRDLKPANLFLTRRADGTPLVKVLDFGIAKAVSETGDGSRSRDTLTGATGFLGSPRYMSPEQIRNARHVDARTDVWAIGVILHELISGRVPFEAEPTTALLAAVLTEPPARLRQHRPGVPSELERIVSACLEKDRGRRMRSVAELAVRLAPFGTEDARLSLARIGGIAGVTGRRRSAHAHRRLLAGALMVCSIGLLASGAWLRYGHRDPVEPPSESAAEPAPVPVPTDRLRAPAVTPSLPSAVAPAPDESARVDEATEGVTKKDLSPRPPARPKRASGAGAGAPRASRKQAAARLDKHAPPIRDVPDVAKDVEIERLFDERK
jgi:serine/threonine-protein kinase